MCNEYVLSIFPSLNICVNNVRSCKSMQEGKEHAAASQTNLGQVDEVGQDSRVMDVQVSLQLIPDGLAEQLQAMVGCLCILLCARTNRYPLRWVIVGCLMPQRAPWLMMTPGAVLGTVASSPTYTVIQCTHTHPQTYTIYRNMLPCNICRAHVVHCNAVGWHCIRNILSQPGMSISAKTLPSHTAVPLEKFRWQTNTQVCSHA